MWGRLVTDFLAGFLAVTLKLLLPDNAKAGNL